MVLGTLALAAAVTARPRAACLMALAALAADLVSLSYHFATGHGPGSPRSLSLPAFLIEHQAFAVAAALAVVALALAFRKRPPRAESSPRGS